MEVSVSFTDGNKDLNAVSGQNSYTVDETVLGRAWIPVDGLVLTSPSRVRYEKHPWMEKFEFDGIKAAPPRRTGPGSKDARGFVKSLSTIWSQAYDSYREHGGDAEFEAEAYFRNAAEQFMLMSRDDSRVRMLKKFCGFTENMWREGNIEMFHICMETVVPVITGDLKTKIIFENSITEEFRKWLAEYRHAAG